jgi:hypothetical protein
MELGSGMKEAVKNTVDRLLIRTELATYILAIVMANAVGGRAEDPEQKKNGQASSGGKAGNIKSHMNLKNQRTAHQLRKTSG